MYLTINSFKINQSKNEIAKILGGSLHVLRDCKRTVVPKKETKKKLIALTGLSGKSK